MKIPKTFRPEKDLDEKLEQLLEEPKKSLEYEGWREYIEKISEMPGMTVFDPSIIEKRKLTKEERVQILIGVPANSTVDKDYKNFLEFAFDNYKKSKKS